MSNERLDPIPAVDAQQSIDWLNRLLGKQLRVHLTDGRMMCGYFKCTDSESFSTH